MQEAIEQSNQALIEQGIHLGIGIGISTGEALVGIFGSNRKKEYTVFGSSVNLASRLERLALSGEILVCPETANELFGTVLMEQMPAVHFKGLEGDISPYRILEKNPEMGMPLAQ